MSVISDSNKTYGNDQTEVVIVINSGASVEGALNVGTTAIEIKVGATRLEDREALTLFNNSANTMYWGYTSSVTTSTGTPIFKNQLNTWSVGDSQPIYVISSKANQDARITEGS